MKFTKEQLSETLKKMLVGKGEELAMSQRTLDAQAEALFAIGVNEETELEDFAKKVLPSLISLEGNYRKDNADFVKKWKDEHGDKPGNAQRKDDKNPNGNGSDDETKLDKLLKEISDMKKEMEAEKKSKAIARKKSELLSKFKEKGISDDKWASDYLDDIYVDEDTDVEQKADKALRLYNQSRSSTRGGTLPIKPGGKGDDDLSKAFDDIVKLRNRNNDK